MSEEQIQSELVKVEQATLSAKRASMWTVIFAGVCASCTLFGIVGSTYKFAGDQAKQDQTTVTNTADIAQLKIDVLSIQLSIAEMQGRLRFISPGYVDPPELGAQRAAIKERIRALAGAQK